jgi:ribonucleotide reductase beta subunit family protein with ferritin-like domain
MDLNIVKNDNKDEDEFLLNSENSRLTTLPIRELDIWEMYKTAEASFWTAEEIKFENEYNEFCKLGEPEQTFIKNILAFFAASDALVNTNLMERFTKEVKVLEAVYFYNFQTMIENIHSEVYSNLIDYFVRDNDEKYRVLNAVETIPCVRKKAMWVYKWINSYESFGTRLIAFSIVEGIFFSGSFCAIYWIKEKNILDALTKSNEFISRDEGLHTDFACLLYSKIKNRLDAKVVENMIRDAVEIETEFITESISCDMIGMNSKLMTEYIKFVSNRLYKKLGYTNNIWEVENPFPFMEKISLSSKTNFFDKRSTIYQSAHVKNKNTKLAISEEF